MDTATPDKHKAFWKAIRNAPYERAIQAVEALLRNDSAKHLDDGYDNGLEDAVEAIRALKR